MSTRMVVNLVFWDRVTHKPQGQWILTAVIMGTGDWPVYKPCPEH